MFAFLLSSSLFYFLNEYSFLSVSFQSQTLQSQLDQECANISAELCNEGEFEHCINPMEYARIIQGETSQDTWWCFSGMDIQKRNVGKHCVNNCGVKANCRGVPTSSPSLAINKDKELRTALSNNKDTYCRAYYERVRTTGRQQQLLLCCCCCAALLLLILTWLERSNSTCFFRLCAASASTASASFDCSSRSSSICNGPISSRSCVGVL